MVWVKFLASKDCPTNAPRLKHLSSAKSTYIRDVVLKLEPRMPNLIIAKIVKHKLENWPPVNAQTMHTCVHIHIMYTKIRVYVKIKTTFHHIFILLIINKNDRFL